MSLLGPSKQRVPLVCHRHPKMVDRALRNKCSTNAPSPVVFVIVIFPRWQKSEMADRALRNKLSISCYHFICHCTACFFVFTVQLTFQMRLRSFFEQAEETKNKTLKLVCVFLLWNAPLLMLIWIPKPAFTSDSRSGKCPSLPIFHAPSLGSWIQKLCAPVATEPDQRECW